MNGVKLPSRPSGRGAANTSRVGFPATPSLFWSIMLPNVVTRFRVTVVNEMPQAFKLPAGAGFVGWFAATRLVTRRIQVPPMAAPVKAANEPSGTTMPVTSPANGWAAPPSAGERYSALIVFPPPPRTVPSKRTVLVPSGATSSTVRSVKLPGRGLVRLTVTRGVRTNRFAFAPVGVGTVSG